MTYNSRRGILGAIPVREQIAYHLFGIDAAASKTEDIVKLYRKSKWHSQYSKAICNWWLEWILLIEDEITSLDFNPSGEYIATIDRKGVCLISEVGTHNYIFHETFDMESTYGGISDKNILFQFYQK